MWKMFLSGTSPSKIVNDGIEQFNKKNYSEAINCFSQALEMDPGSAIAAIAWGRKGNCYVSMQQYREAVECYDRSLEINPSASNIWFIKGFVLHLIGRSNEALLCLDRAIEINPEYGAAWESKGDALLGLYRYEEALACYTTALGLNPEHETRLADTIALCRSLQEGAQTVAGGPEDDSGETGHPPAVLESPPLSQQGAPLSSDNGSALEEIKLYEETVRQFLTQLETASWKIVRNRIEQDSTTIHDQIRDQRQMIQELCGILTKEQELIKNLGIILEIQSNFIDRLVKEVDVQPEKQSQ